MKCVNDSSGLVVRTTSKRRESLVQGEAKVLLGDWRLELARGGYDIVRIAGEAGQRNGGWEGGEEGRRRRKKREGEAKDGEVFPGDIIMGGVIIILLLIVVVFSRLFFLDGREVKGRCRTASSACPRRGVTYRPDAPLHRLSAAFYTAIYTPRTVSNRI